LHMIQLMPLPFKPHHLLPHLNPDVSHLVSYRICAVRTLLPNRVLPLLVAAGGSEPSTKDRQPVTCVCVCVWLVGAGGGRVRGSTAR